MDRKYSRLLCRAIPNSSITCPPSPAIMRLRRVRFSNGATNLYWVRLYTAQYGGLTCVRQGSYHPNVNGRSYGAAKVAFDSPGSSLWNQPGSRSGVSRIYGIRPRRRDLGTSRID